MTKEKKRPSKNARAARKILEDSKLLSAAKTTVDSKADQTFKPSESSVKTSSAIKTRPDKKRG